MKLAVMQPYLFPYIGYFQLVHAADLFILYDDVNYITRGYINRNQVLVNGRAQRFTIPVPGASQNRRISELCFDADVRKCLRTLQQAYAKAPHFKAVYPWLEAVLCGADRSITAVCEAAITAVFGYLGLPLQLRRASTLEYDRSLPAQERLIALCRQFGAGQYLNSPGGRALYDKAAFAAQGVALAFLEPEPVCYPQGAHAFVPNLSVIDPLMWCSRDEVAQLMTRYRLA